jgi:hypothetical protein
VELISYVRLLWSRRWLTALVLVAAILVGVLVSYRVTLSLPPRLHTRVHYLGEASAQVLIDTSHSQIADLNPDPTAPAGYLDGHATLLADLLATSPIDQTIAQRVDIPFNQLKVTPPPGSIVPPVKASPLAIAAEKSDGAAAGPYELTITVEPDLPIIALTTVAPTPQQAQQLATATINVLTERVDALATKQSVPTAERALVDQIGPPRAGPVARGPRKLYGLAAVVIVFLLGTFAIVAATGTDRRRASRRASAAHEAIDADLLVSDGMAGPMADVTHVHIVDPAAHAYSRSRQGAVPTAASASQPDA